jgi:hypothetical protein
MQLVLNLQHHQHLRCGVGVVGVGLLSWNLEPSAISFSCNNNHMDCEPVMHFYWLLNYASKIQLMEQVYSASNRTLNTENALFCKKCFRYILWTAGKYITDMALFQKFNYGITKILTLQYIIYSLLSHRSST